MLASMQFHQNYDLWLGITLATSSSLPERVCVCFSQSGTHTLFLIRLLLSLKESLSPSAVVPNQGCPLKGHVRMSRDIFGCHNLEGGIGGGVAIGT